MWWDTQTMMVATSRAGFCFFIANGNVYISKKQKKIHTKKRNILESVSQTPDGLFCQQLLGREYRAVKSVSVLCPLYTPLKRNLLASSSTNLLPLGCPAESRADRAAVLCWAGVGLCGSWHGVVELSKEHPRPVLGCRMHLLCDWTPILLYGLDM